MFLPVLFIFGKTLLLLSRFRLIFCAKKKSGLSNADKPDFKQDVIPLWLF